jgi:hypothetical protein
VGDGATPALKGKGVEAGVGADIEPIAGGYQILEEQGPIFAEQGHQSVYQGDRGGDNDAPIRGLG